MKKVLSLLLVFFMLVTILASCKKNDTDDQSDSGAQIDSSLPVRVYTLNGTTGFGMAQLMDSKTKGTAALNYSFTVENDATLVRDALINGTADIAAVPTNVASVLYNATNGGVRVLSLNTAGVLYLVVNANRVSIPTALSDLSGKTVYCPAQNPEFITRALLSRADVADVTVNSTTYAKPEELRTALATGVEGVDYAILPEPMVTIACNAANTAGINLGVALDLTCEWDKVFPAGSLVQGCVVARTEFVNAHPNEIAQFLSEYGVSVEYVKNHPEEGASMIASANIFANAAIAKAALPKCNLIYVTGAPMKSALSEFLSLMPLNSVGGKLPADDFYFGA